MWNRMMCYRIKMTVRTQLIGLGVLTLLLGCAAAPEVPSLDQPSVLELVDVDLWGAGELALDEQQIFGLTSEQSEQFFAYFNDETLVDQAPHWRVYNYVERFADKFDFFGATHVARDALAKREGNCMSLAIVTTALARLVDVPIGYQLIDSAPVYERKGDLVLRGRHVRTLLHNRETREVDGETSYTSSTLVVDYFPDKSHRLARRIEEDDYIAMYYRNLAADSLVANQLDDAFTFATAAAKLAPIDADVISLLALIHRRAGDVEAAEKIYRFGMEHAQDRLSLMNNYRNLLLNQGRTEQANQLSELLSQYDNDHPYHWLGLAHSRYANRDLPEAERFYLKTLDLAPYLHEAHMGLARVKYAQGDRTGAKRSLDRALLAARDQQTQGLYQAKLDALTH